MTQVSVLQRLRTATAPAHQILDSRLDAVAGLSSLADRRRLLVRYYRMHASAEAAVSRWLADVPDLDEAQRRRTPLLDEDLHALGLETPARSSLPCLVLAGPAEALGVMYVMEGSTLGGRMIRKALDARGVDDDRGLSFLDPYGRLTGERWRAFLAVLEREGAADPEGVARGGRLGFDHAQACLLGVEAPL